MPPLSQTPMGALDLTDQAFSRLNGAILRKVNEQQLLQQRRDMERQQQMERQFGVARQGYRPQTLGESTARTLRDITGQSAMERGMARAGQFKAEHGIMNPPTLQEYAATTGMLALDAAEGVLGAVDLTATAPALTRAATKGAIKSYQATRGALKQAKLPGLIEGIGGEAGMVAWHGTPHKFTPAETNPLGEFDLGKIGTGEGAQAYGHGIYLAEGKGTAKYYQEELARPPGVAVGGKNITYMGADKKTREAIDFIDSLIPQENPALSTFLSGDRKTFEAAKVKGLGVAKQQGDNELVEAITKMEFAEGGGHLYEVDLPDTEIDKMLDWDNWLDDMPKDVQSKLDKAMRAAGVEDSLIKESPDGQTIYRQLSKKLGGDAAASEKLSELGIPGIKYLDATSRGAGDGTRNFVVFDPKIAKIVGRNGEKISK